MGKIFLESGNLIFRQMDERDFDDLAEMLKDKEVMSAWEYDFTDEDIYDWIKRNKELYTRYECGYFLLEDKGTGIVVGQAALKPDIIEGQEYYEVGYILKKKFWGKGYATAAAKALAEYAHKKLGQEYIILEIRPENIRSRKIAERLGAEESGSFIKNVRGKQMKHLIYKMFMIN